LVGNSEATSCEACPVVVAAFCDVDNHGPQKSSAGQGCLRASPGLSGIGPLVGSQKLAGERREGTNSLICIDTEKKTKEKEK
jgi:hypothetical protein